MARPVGPYSPFVRGGGLVFTAGQVGIADGSLVEGGFEAQLRQTFANLRNVLESAGRSLDDVVKTTVFLVDIDDYPEMNRVYVDEMGDHRPARSAVAVARLPLGALVEIEAVALDA
ncbi:MAG: RidA family protein [Acidimicrobiales bacterium]